MQEHFHFTTDQAKIQKPLRKNPKTNQSKAWKQWMRRKCKVIETVFSVLVDQYRTTGIRANSVSGFETALDGILPAYFLVVLGLVECKDSTSTTGNII